MSGDAIFYVYNTSNSISTGIQPDATHAGGAAGFPG